jgi:hypothetical protein
MFTSLTFFTAMGDVHAFAGADPEVAVVEEAARRALSRWDERVVHHEVAVDLPELPAARTTGGRRADLVHGTLTTALPRAWPCSTWRRPSAVSARG